MLSLLVVPSQRTFGVLKTWINELQRHGPDGIVLAIAGNKSDLEEKRMVSLCEVMGVYVQPGWCWKLNSLGYVCVCVCAARLVLEVK